VSEAGRPAAELVEGAAQAVLDKLGTYVWATGDSTWSQAIGQRILELGWTVSVVEIATGGSLNALFGDAPWVRFDESIASDAPAAKGHVPAAPSAADDQDDDPDPDDLTHFARRARELGGSEVGVAVRARPRTGDTAVSIAISTPTREVRVRRVVFLTGPMGRSRVALAAAAVLFETLGEATATD
jgi:hypothetical protein